MLGTVTRAADEQKIEPPEAASIAAIEKDLGGRLGVAILDTGDGRRLEYHAVDRFPMCSTFKFLAAAAVLRRVDENQEQLERKISYGPGDLQAWAPVTKQHVQEGNMTLDALCAAAVEYSDNTAANILLQTIGGPDGLTQYVRSLGDSITRLDEPTLNTALEGDERDTTNPVSMLNDLQTLLLDEKLSVSARQRLETWLLECKTGDKRLRAGLPSTWNIGDKTGTGDNSAAGDVAIARPPNRAPLLIVAYTVGSTATKEKINGAFAAIGSFIAKNF